MRAVHDLEDLRPVVCEVPRASEHAQVNEGVQPSPRAGCGPAKADGHELDDRALPSGAADEMDLNRGRQERQFLPLLRILDVGKHGPQAPRSCHAVPMVGPFRLPSACT